LAAIVWNITNFITFKLALLLIIRVKGTKVISATSLVMSIELKKVKYIKTNEIFLELSNLVSRVIAILSNIFICLKALTIIMRLNNVNKTLKSMYSTFGKEKKEVIIANVAANVKTTSPLKILNNFADLCLIATVVNIFYHSPYVNYYQMQMQN